MEETTPLQRLWEIAAGTWIPANDSSAGPGRPAALTQVWASLGEPTPSTPTRFYATGEPVHHAVATDR
ncbi:hypothetical protein BH24ACT1_BH24ACT1_05340 [soil metagenome]